MKRIKLLIMLLVAILLLSSCTAASTTLTAGSTAGTASAPTTTAKVIENFNKTGYPIVIQPITLKITGQMNSLATTWKDNLQLAYLTKLTGIKFEAEGISSDAWATQKPLCFASGSLPDLFVSAGFTTSELLEYGSGKQLIALSDLVKAYGQNIEATFKQFPISVAMCTASDGKMYTLPRISPVVRDMHNRYWINKVWLDKLSLKVPTTLNELYTVLKAFQTGDANGNGDAADEIPLTGVKGASSYEGLILNALGVNVKTAAYGITADNKGTVYCANTSEAYKAYLTYMRKLYAEKLLDNEYFVQTNEQLAAKAQKNIVGGCQASAMYITAGTELGYNYTQFDALTSDLNQTKMVTASTGISIGTTAITSANKYPEATLRLLDYFYTEEGGKLAYVGEEGVGWKWLDKAAGSWDKVQPEGYKTAEDFRATKGTLINAWSSWERTEFNAGQGSKNALWLNQMSKDYSYPYFVNQFPKSSLSLSVSDSEQVSKIEADLTNYVTEASARFISGEDDITKGWDAYVNNMKKMGSDTVATIYQKYYTAFLASMK